MTEQEYINSITKNPQLARGYTEMLFSEYFNNLKSGYVGNVEPVYVIIDNFNTIKNQIGVYEFGTLLTDLISSNYKTGRKILESKLIDILNMFYYETDANIFEKYPLFATLSPNKFKYYRKIIEDNFALILEKQNEFTLQELIVGIRGKSETTDKMLKIFLENNKRLFVQSYLFDCGYIFDVRNTELAEEKRVCEDIFINLFNSLCKSEHRNYFDIRRLGSGSYSTAYLVGSKVVKLGAQRDTPTIPNHRRLLQPIIRRSISKNMYLEVVERVDAEPDITNDDVYNVYAELRRDGLLWTDPSKDNIGMLLRPNRVYMPIDAVSKNSSRLYGVLDAGYSSAKGSYADVIMEEPNPKIRGLNRIISKSDSLGEGELVVIDSDFIYNVNPNEIIDVKKYPWARKFSSQYEELYQKEINPLKEF